MKETTDALTDSISIKSVDKLLGVFKQHMSWMTNNDAVEKAMKTLTETNTRIDKNEKEILANIALTSQKIVNANNLAAKAVTTLVGFVKAVLATFDGVGKEDVKTVKPAVTLFMNGLEKEILPDLKETYFAVQKATKALQDTKFQLKKLHDHLEREITELVQEEEEAVTISREKAYEGTAGATVGVAAQAIVTALNHWKPKEWVVAAAVAGTAVAGTALTFAVTAAVEEGGKVRKLRGAYKATIGELKRSLEGMDNLIKQTGEFQAQFLDKIVLIEESEDIGKLILAGTDGLLLGFKKSLDLLKTSCEEYIAENDTQKHVAKR